MTIIYCNETCIKLEMEKTIKWKYFKQMYLDNLFEMEIEILS